MKQNHYDFFQDYLLDNDQILAPKPMFGCLGLYRGLSLLVVLKEKGDKDRGIWICTDYPHHESLIKDLGPLPYISVFGDKSRWLLLAENSAEFEESAFKLADLIIAQDSRIGRVGKKKGPSKRRSSKSKTVKTRNLQKKK